MTLDEAIEYQKKTIRSHEVLGDNDAEDVADLEREKAFLYFFEDLKWLNEGMPVPEQMKELKLKVDGLDDVVNTAITRPKHFDGFWWLDGCGEHKSFCVEFRPKLEKPWGVSLTAGTKKADEPGFGEGPDEVFSTIGEVVEHIWGLRLGARDG